MKEIFENSGTDKKYITIAVNNFSERLIFEFISIISVFLQFVKKNYVYIIVQVYECVRVRWKYITISYAGQ